VSKVLKFEGRKTVEEKDVRLEPDEEKDVEGHKHHVVLEPDEENARQDEGEGEDVEAHSNVGFNQGVNNAADAAQVGREDEGDDVEGHAQVN
jgi:hypothetical protein